MTGKQIAVETIVAAPVTMAWQAYTTPGDITHWNAASDDWHRPSASVGLREGSKFVSRMEARDGGMGFDFDGTYTAIVPHEPIAYTFGGREAVV